jgi:hypothetical protein
MTLLIDDYCQLKPLEIILLTFSTASLEKHLIEIIPQHNVSNNSHEYRILWEQKSVRLLQ